MFKIPHPFINGLYRVFLLIKKHSFTGVLHAVWTIDNCNL